MKNIYTFLMLLIFTSSLSAQNYGYRLDTVKVDKTDSRNIYQYDTQQKRIIDAKEVEKASTEIPGVFNPKNLRFGVNLGMSFSRNYTFVNIGPQVGYEFNKYFLLGAGLRYYYSKTRGYTYNNEYIFKNNMLGANVFGYFHPVRFIALFVQPELNYLWSKEQNMTTGQIDNDSGWVPSFVVGGGVRLGRIYITLNYDLAKQDRSPYPHGTFWSVSTFF